MTLVCTHLKTLARDVAKMDLPKDTSIALSLQGARDENPSTVPRIVPGRTFREVHTHLTCSICIYLPLDILVEAFQNQCIFHIFGIAWQTST